MDQSFENPTRQLPYVSMNVKVRAPSSVHSIDRTPLRQFVKLLPEHSKVPVGTGKFTYNPAGVVTRDKRRVDGTKEHAPGLSFSRFSDIYKWMYLYQHTQNVPLLWDVTVPAGEEIVSINTTYKAESIVLSNPRPVPYEVWLRAVEHDAYNISLVPPEFQTEELCEAALYQNAHLIRFVHEPTPALCDLAISLNPHAAYFIRK